MAGMTDFNLIVEAPPQIVIDAISDTTVKVGRTKTVTVNTNAAGSIIEAECASPGIANVTVSGNSLTLEGIAPGSTTVTVTAKKNDYTDGTATFILVVEALPQIAVETINPVSIKTGQTQEVTVAANVEGTVISAESQNPGTASVAERQQADHCRECRREHCDYRNSRKGRIHHRYGTVCRKCFVPESS